MMKCAVFTMHIIKMWRIDGGGKILRKFERRDIIERMTLSLT